ncbi:aromatic ring-hydroxylating dioxygenase subunit alpha [Novosphingobium aquae]|uniref:Aromatic ring-hydroxylating dioxygenase subunit alpha n=1 Tax=Novosphingobium aquae TaxID=3133435 RepID=A0ABU8S470_9SPHN
MNAETNVTAQAWSIPTEAYLSPDYARAERDAIWRKVWQVACREEEIEKPGDFVTYDILDDSIIVTRQDDGAIKAYHNVCPHRGRKLTEGCGHAKGFKCGFHGWTWALDGRNLGVTRKSGYGDSLSADDIRLKDVRAETWGGWVFITMDPDAVPLRAYLGEVAPLLDPFEMQNMRYRWRQWLHFPCNWKVAVEAFNEGYHVIGTHPQLAVYSDKPTWSRSLGIHGNFGALQREGVGGGTAGAAGAPDMRVGLATSLNQVWKEVWATTTQTMVDVANKLVDELPEGTSAMEVQMHFMRRVIEEDARNGITWPALDPKHAAEAGTDVHIFPNTVLIYGPTFALCYRARPNGYDPDSCIFEVYTLEKFAEGQEPKPENLYKPEQTLDHWPVVLLQDFSNMGAVQQGMKSMAFSSARPHPTEEEAVVGFHRALAGYMGTGGPVEVG